MLQRQELDLAENNVIHIFMHFVWQPWNIAHCARHGVTPALAEAVILSEDFSLDAPQAGSIRRVGYGTVDDVRYKIVFQRGEPDEIFIISCYRAQRGSRKNRPRSDKP
jgi:hypothetical protein